MRGVKAKALRRKARAETKGLPERRYETNKYRRYYTEKGKRIEFIVSQVRLAPNCGRAVYQRLKAAA